MVTTAVGLSSFTDHVEGARVRVAWTSLQELNVSGYYVYNSVSATGLRTRINDAMIPARGSASAYEVIDPSGHSGDLYWIEAVSAQGSIWYGPAVAESQNWRRVFLPFAPR